MRIEECNHDWVRTWAFKISERKATHEGYEKAKSSGSMQPTPEYPGCPYCGSMDIAQCACGKLFCWTDETNTAVCPWCGQKGEYHTVENIEFEGRGL
jgi:transcription elongation factor Elf1